MQENQRDHPSESRMRRSGAAFESAIPSLWKEALKTQAEELRLSDAQLYPLIELLRQFDIKSGEPVLLLTIYLAENDLLEMAQLRQITEIISKLHVDFAAHIRLHQRLLDAVSSLVSSQRADTNRFMELLNVHFDAVSLDLD